MKITIQFDGGCTPNPGQMYGSYLIEREDGLEILRASMLAFGKGTNNEAEFLTLETAIDKLLVELSIADFSPKKFFVEIETDSTIVQRRIANAGNNRTYDLAKVSPQKQYGRSRANRMSQLAMRCHSLLAQFAGHKIRWQPRERNVEAFGH